jgi:hypothetical protein
MAPRQRPHLVHALMDEANLMRAVLEQAMEGVRSEARHPHPARDASSPWPVQLGG